MSKKTVIISACAGPPPRQCCRRLGHGIAPRGQADTELVHAARTPAQDRHARIAESGGARQVVRLYRQRLNI